MKTVLLVASTFFLLGLGHCQMSQPIQFHKKNLQCAEFTPDEKMFVTTSGDSMIIFWDVKTGKQERVFKPCNMKIESVAFDSKGEIIALGGDNAMEVDLYSYPDLKLLDKFIIPDSIMGGARLSVEQIIVVPEKGKLFALLNHDKIASWDLQTRQFACTHTGFTSKIDYSEKEGLLLTSDGVFSIWDDGLKPKFTNEVGDSFGTRVFFTDTLLVVGISQKVNISPVSDSVSIRIYDVSKHQYTLSSPFFPCISFVYNSFFSKDSKLIYFIQQGGISIWDLNTNTFKQITLPTDVQVSTISKRGNLILTGNASCIEVMEAITLKRVSLTTCRK